MRYYEAQPAHRSTVVSLERKRREKRGRAGRNGSGSDGGSPGEPEKECNRKK